MELSGRDRERLADVVRLQPTKNGELQERWGMESGSEVHQYLESALSEYYFRDEDSLIRATPEAAELVDVEPGIQDEEDGSLRVRVPPLEATLLDVLPGPDERSVSVVAAMEAVREAGESEVDADDVRDALQRLRRKDAVEVVYRLVPTYRLARPRAAIEAAPLDD